MTFTISPKDLLFLVFFGWCMMGLAIGYSSKKVNNWISCRNIVKFFARISVLCGPLAFVAFGGIFGIAAVLIGIHFVFEWLFIKD